MEGGVVLPPQASPRASQSLLGAQGRSGSTRVCFGVLPFFVISPNFSSLSSLRRFSVYISRYMLAARQLASRPTDELSSSHVACTNDIVVPSFQGMVVEAVRGVRGAPLPHHHMPTSPMIFSARAKISSFFCSKSFLQCFFFSFCDVNCLQCFFFLVFAT